MWHRLQSVPLVLPLTVSRVGKGAPTVSIGIYLQVLYALQLEDYILHLAEDVELGRRLQEKLIYG